MTMTSTAKIKSLRKEFSARQGQEYNGTGADLSALWLETKSDFGKSPQTKKISPAMHEHFMSLLQTDHLDRSN
jgi:hypothetical protein